MEGGHCADLRNTERVKLAELPSQIATQNADAAITVENNSAVPQNVRH